MMAGVTHSLRDVQTDLLKMISQETILARREASCSSPCCAAPVSFCALPGRLRRRARAPVSLEQSPPPPGRSATPSRTT